LKLERAVTITLKSTVMIRRPNPMMKLEPLSHVRPSYTALSFANLAIAFQIM
jgi:hypothetical protein